MYFFTYLGSYTNDLTIVCRDGRIKVIGGDGIEGLLISPEQLPLKHLEVFQTSVHIMF